MYMFCYEAILSPVLLHRDLLSYILQHPVMLHPVLRLPVLPMLGVCIILPALKCLHMFCYIRLGNILFCYILFLLHEDVQHLASLHKFCNIRFVTTYSRVTSGYLFRLPCPPMISPRGSVSCVWEGG
jgi:hypothetical protein